MYDPTVGRWMSEDPIGFDGKDANLYRYVNNEPTRLADPTGLMSGDAYLTRMKAVRKLLCDHASFYVQYIHDQMAAGTLILMSYEGMRFTIYEYDMSKAPEGAVLPPVRLDDPRKFMNKPSFEEVRKSSAESFGTLSGNILRFDCLEEAGDIAATLVHELTHHMNKSYQEFPGGDIGRDPVLDEIDAHYNEEEFRSAAGIGHHAEYTDENGIKHTYEEQKSWVGKRLFLNEYLQRKLGYNYGSHEDTRYYHAPDFGDRVDLPGADFWDCDCVE